MLFVFFAGCLSLPTREEQEKTWKEASAYQVVDNYLKDPSFIPGDWPSFAWWEMFSDQQLNQFMLMALKQNPTLKQSLSTVKRAYQLAKSEKSLLYPEVDFHADFTYDYFGKNNFFRKFDPKVFPANIYWYELFFNFSYDFDLWGQNRNRYLSKLNAAKAEAAASAFSTLNICALVAQTYFLLQTHFIRVSILERLLKERQKFYALEKQRQVAGLKNISGELEADVTRISLENQLFEEQKSLAVTKHLLFALLGEGPDSSVVIEKIDVLFEKPFPLPDVLTVNLIARRPDLMAEIWNVESKSHSVGVAKAAFYPNVNLLAYVGLQSVNSLSQFFTLNSGEAQAVPALNLPLFTGGRLKANLSAAEADFEAAVESYHAQLLTALREVADQVTIVSYLDKELNVEKEKLKSSKDLFNLALNRFDAALDTSLDVIVAEENFFQEELIWINLKMQKLLALVNLIKSLGGGYFQNG